MTIYTFNLLVGFEPNGVDVAQASRAKMLRGLGVAAKFIFTTWPTPEKLAYYLSLGHRDEELLFAHLAFLRINRLRSLKRRWGPCKWSFN